MKHYHKCERCGEYTIPKRSPKTICKKCENKQKLEKRTFICKSCGKPFIKHSVNMKTIYCNECKDNGNAGMNETENQKKLFIYLNNAIDFQNLVKIMFNIYFNKDIKNKLKISYKENTSDYNQFLYKNLKKSIQFANNFISKLSSFLYDDFKNGNLSEEKIKQIIDKINEIKNINYWKKLSIKNTDLETYIKYHNIKFSINNDIEAIVYKFLFSFVPDCGKQYGKGEFLRHYISNLSPNLFEKGDCMIDENSVAELKNANKKERGILLFNRHNYLTLNGRSSAEMLDIFINKNIKIINEILQDNEYLKNNVINLIKEANNCSDFIWKYNDSNKLYNKIANILNIDLNKKTEFIYKTMLINLCNSDFTGIYINELLETDSDINTFLIANYCKYYFDVDAVSEKHLTQIEFITNKGSLIITKDILNNRFFSST